LDQVKQSLFDIIVSRLYDVLMSSTVLLGKVQYEISDQCNEDTVLSKLKERIILKAKKEEQTISEEEDKEEYAKKCLGLYELYGKINFYRETTFVGHLDRINDLVKDDTPTSSVLSRVGYKPSATKSKINSHAYRLLILDVLRQMQENNKVVFKPLANAFNNVKLRYLINYYHTYSKKYEYLKKYMETLDLKEDALKNIMFCRTEALTGSCTLRKENAEESVTNFHFRSAFVPEGKKLKVSYTTASSNDGIQILGPGTMANMFYNEGDDKKTNPVKKYLIADYKKEAKERIVSLCTFTIPEAGKDLDPLHKAVCTDKDIDIAATLPVSIDVKDIKCGSKGCFEGKPIAVGTDETDIAYTAHKTVEISSTNEKFKITWGPFFGPINKELGCGSILWENIKFYRYKSKEMTTAEQAQVTRQTDPNLCANPGNLLCDDKVIDKSYFLKICKDKSLKGYCQEIPLIKGQANNKVIDLKRIGVFIEKIQGTLARGSDVSNNPEILKKIEKTAYDDEVDDCVWFQRDSKVSTNHQEKVNLLRSMKIPDGMIVELYTEFGATGEMFGPYEGPLTVDRVDGNDIVGGQATGSYIKSIKLLETP